MIPMVDLKTQYAGLKTDIEQGMHAVLDSCAFIMGPNVNAFETEVAEYLSVAQAIGVASGTDALYLALTAEGIGAGDEVITTAFTFIATAEAIRNVGATPIFVDIDPKTFNISPDAIEQAITPDTKAVLPVHLFGQPCDMISIQDICNRHHLKLIEDCAQSFGASIDSKQTGRFGNVAGFSFFPSKNLGAYGDGGLLVTESKTVADKVRQLRNHGSSQRYYHDVIGCNSRLDEIQAMILRIKLRHIEEYNRQRRQTAHLYSELLKDLPLTVPYEDDIGRHVYHQYTILCERRDVVQKALQEHQIASAIYYPVPLHQQKAFITQCTGLSLPKTESVANNCLSLPICPQLTESNVRLITQVIRDTLSV